MTSAHPTARAEKSTLNWKLPCSCFTSSRCVEGHASKVAYSFHSWTYWACWTADYQAVTSRHALFAKNKISILRWSGPTFSNWYSGLNCYCAEGAVPSFNFEFSHSPTQKVFYSLFSDEAVTILSEAMVGLNSKSGENIKISVQGWQLWVWSIFWWICEK